MKEYGRSIIICLWNIARVGGRGGAATSGRRRSLRMHGYMQSRRVRRRRRRGNWRRRVPGRCSCNGGCGWNVGCPWVWWWHTCVRVVLACANHKHSLHLMHDNIGEDAVGAYWPVSGLTDQQRGARTRVRTITDEMIVSPTPTAFHDIAIGAYRV